MAESKKNQELAQEDFEQLQKNIKIVAILYKLLNIPELVMINQATVLSKLTPNPFKVLKDKAFTDERRELMSLVPKHKNYKPFSEPLSLLNKPDYKEGELLTAAQKKIIKQILNKTTPPMEIAQIVLLGKPESMGSTLLHLAVKLEQFDMVETLVKELDSSQINATRKNGATALHLAAVGGHKKIVKKLLEKLDAKQINAIYPSNERTALHLAAERGHHTTVSVLIRKLKQLDAASINPLAQEGLTALHIAASKGYHLVVNELITELTAAQINSALENGYTALDIATERGHSTIVRALIKKLKQLDAASINPVAQEGLTALHIAASKGHHLIVNELITELNAEQINAALANGYTALHHAAKRGHHATVSVLIRKLKQLDATSINPLTEEGLTALHIAAGEGHHLVVNELITELNAEQINAALANGYTALHLAAKRGHHATVSVLIRKLKQLDATLINPLTEEGFTALHIAASKGHHLVVNELITELNAEQINTAHKSTGSTALHIAAELGKHETVSLLINKLKPRHINVTQENGYTALHFAVANGYSKIVKEIIEKLNADQIIFPRNQGFMVLHFAAAIRHFEILTILIDRLKKLDAKPTHMTGAAGITPLHIAAISGGDVRIVETLIKVLGVEGINSRCHYREDYNSIEVKKVYTDDATALILAVMQRNTLVIEKLVALVELDINAAFLGATCLHFAAATGNLPAVVALLKHEKINIFLKNTQGQTALQCAQAKNLANTEIIAVLREKEKMSLLPAVPESLAPPLSSSAQIRCALNKSSFLIEWDKYSENLTNHIQKRKPKTVGRSGYFPSLFIQEEDKEKKENKHTYSALEELEKCYKQHYYPMQENDIYSKSNKRVFVHVADKVISDLHKRDKTKHENAWLSIETLLKEGGRLAFVSGGRQGIKLLKSHLSYTYELSIKGKYGDVRLCSSLEPQHKAAPWNEKENIIIIVLDQITNHIGLNKSKPNFSGSQPQQRLGK